MIDFLRFDQGVDPGLLAFFKSSNHFRLVQKMLLVLAKVLGANVFDLAELFVILLLEGFTMSLSR